MAGRRRRDGGGQDLVALVRSGEAGAYEALQLFRSRCSRLRQKGDFRGAVDEAARGCMALCPEYEKAGAELALALVEVLAEGDLDCSPENLSAVQRVDAAFPPRSAARIEFLLAAIKWSMRCGSRELGDPALHGEVAACFWEAGDRAKAVYHFTAAEAPEQLWSHLKGAPEEEQTPLFVFAVCQFLAIESIRDAGALLELQRKTRKSPAAGIVQFADYLVQTCKRDAAPLFQALVQAYGPELERFPVILQLVMGPIALRYFNLRQQGRPDMMTMLQNALGGGAH